MTTLRLPPLGTAPVGRDGPWPLLAAMVLTGMSFGALLVSMRHSATWALADAPARTPPPELVVLVPLRAPPPVPVPVPAPVPLTSVRTRVRSYDATRAIETPSGVVDSAVQSVSRAAARPANITPSNEPGASMPMGMSSRLTAPSAPATPWYTPPVVRNPFMPPPPPTAAEQDSITKLMAAAMEKLAARRVPTVAERDAAAKEAMLKIRNSGRALMVPPDNTGGLIATRISVPVLSRGPTKAQRAKTEQIVAENRARLERLKQRADSLRRSRADSLP